MEIHQCKSILTIKENPDDHFNMYKETFDKIQHSFMIKTFLHLGMKENSYMFSSSVNLVLVSLSMQNKNYNRQGIRSPTCAKLTLAL